jgi:hypothetical protein
MTLGMEPAIFQLVASAATMYATAQPPPPLAPLQIQLETDYEYACMLRMCYICTLCCSHTTAIFTHLHKSHLYEELYLLGNNAMQTLKAQPTFRRNMLPPSSGLKNKPNRNRYKSWRKAEQLCLPSAFTLVPFSSYSSNRKTEVTCSSEISVGLNATVLTLSLTQHLCVRNCAIWKEEK